MTPKMQRFVAEYAIDQNATQAAIRAGYSKKRAAVTGSELLRNPEVLTEIDGMFRKVTERALVDAEYVTRKTVEMVEYGTELVPARDMFGKPIIDETGEPVMRMRDWRAGDSGLNRLSKLFSEYSDKHEVSGDISMRVEALQAISSMSPEQLKALAENARG